MHTQLETHESVASSGAIIATRHRIVHGDARNLAFLDNETVHLVVTSPPYWSLKRYPEAVGQMGNVEDYSLFLKDLRRVLTHCYRVLVPGGRVCCVVGDVCLSRRKHGRHRIVPLHADIVVMCRELGFDNLNPIIWHKISNAHYEVENGTRFFGKPYEPNAIIKNDIEYILMQRKPGGYRRPTHFQREMSRLAKHEYEAWFRQFWSVRGESTRKHPAPFPLEVAYRLVRMFSFSGDTVLDPFAGTGTTSAACVRAQRHSISVEIDPEYVNTAFARLQREASSFLASAEVFQEKQPCDAAMRTID